MVLKYEGLHDHNKVHLRAIESHIELKISKIIDFITSNGTKLQNAIKKKKKDM